MRITFDKDELRDFMGILSEWFAERDRYVLDHFPDVTGPFPHLDRRQLGDALVRTRQRFEEKKPRPDWRQLL